MQMIKNPFITMGYAGPEYFCDRELETDEIIKLITNGNHVALVSPRRYGKTDLLRHCFSQRDIKDDYYTFIIDIYSTKSFADMVNQLGKVILETLKPKGRKVWEQFIQILVSVRTGITFDSLGNPSWTLEIGDITNPVVTLEEIFRYLDNADKPCIVAIDEFQQITKYGDENIEARIRTQVQYCRNAVFVFSGSQRHLMGSIFTSPARPFYQSVTIYNLNLIPLEKYRAFCEKHFENYGKHLDEGVVDSLYSRFEGITFYLQRVMNDMFMRTSVGGVCQMEDIDLSVANIVRYSSTVYEDLLYQLPEKQSMVLKAISKDGAVRNITSGAFMKRHNLPSVNSVKAAVPALVDKQLVTNERGVYKVYDKFLAVWLNM